MSYQASSAMMPSKRRWNACFELQRWAAQTTTSKAGWEMPSAATTSKAGLEPVWLWGPLASPWALGQATLQLLPSAPAAPRPESSEPRWVFLETERN
mmetsp:Transcript_84481/g.152390  ORF Transcript_84481/g.152390 Transcript_84481/m.152390 type:complete len:97 (+) Transcript_84481:522-812(+)